MTSRPRILGIALVLLALGPPASAQYMYLDSNADGVHTAADVLHEVGPTVVDIWLDTSHNRDGSMALCTPDPNHPLTMFSYLVTIKASGGTVNYSPFTNRIAQMFQLQGGFADDIQLTTPAFAMPPGTSLPPGKFLLGTLTVNVASGTPSIQIDPGSSNPFTLTCFGSNCAGTAYGNTIVFGIDWYDADGLAYGPGGGSNQAPALSPVTNMTLPTGENGAQALTASDPEGQPLTFSKSSGPSFMFVYTRDQGHGTAQGEIRLAPFVSDAGTSEASLTVSDGAASDQATFEIAVSAGPNHPPYIAAVPRLTVIAGRVGTSFLSAGDPDGSPIHITKASGPDFVSVRELAVGAGGTSAVLTAAPTLCDVGSATTVITATDGVTQQERQVGVDVIAPSPTPDPTVIRYLFTDTRFPTAIVTGDLDRDGKLDAVMSFIDNATIFVYLGRGDGTLAPPVSYPVAGGAMGLAIADLNGDGILDAAVPNSNGVGVSVLLGRGDGTFLPGSLYDTGNGPQGIAATDLNRDGILDLVTCNHEGGTVSALTGIGDGTFAPRRDSPLGVNPTALVVGDFNLDGRPDVVTAHGIGGQVSTLTMLPGLGDGTFGDAVHGPLTRYALSVSSADWNSDGFPDVATVDAGRGNVLVLNGRGDGTFDPPTTVAQLGFPWGLAPSDLNGDGNMDLLAADSRDVRVAILLGNGHGGFASPTFLELLGASGCVAAGDLNSDGRPDILAGDSDIAIVLNALSSGATPADARAFVRGGHKTLPSAAGAGNLYVQVEPVAGSYTNDQLVLGSLTLHSEGTGSVDEIHSVEPRRVVVADTDRNGVPEIEACFSRRDLATLFDQVRGRRTVTARLTGSLTDARAFCSSVELELIGTGGPSIIASFAPNPFNPQSKLSLTTAREGPAQALLFDIQGRLVRTLLDTPRLPAGPHELSFDGKNDRGGPLSSGVYFYRVRSTEGVVDGQIVILK